MESEVLKTGMNLIMGKQIIPNPINTQQKN